MLSVKLTGRSKRTPRKGRWRRDPGDSFVWGLDDWVGGVRSALWEEVAMSEQCVETPRVFGPNFERLKLLLEHMELGSLAVDEFHFGAYRHVTSCGTMGCMA